MTYALHLESGQLPRVAVCFNHAPNSLFTAVDCCIETSQLATQAPLYYDVYQER